MLEFDLLLSRKPPRMHDVSASKDTEIVTQMLRPVIAPFPRPGSGEFSGLFCNRVTLFEQWRAVPALHRVRSCLCFSIDVVS